ncbi:MAG: hypothetical protein GJ677_03375 [Rhodobacteraceae bacterium]|nr:hypothetical protein [Paracoccaceae bacterium]
MAVMVFVLFVTAVGFVLGKKLAPRVQISIPVFYAVLAVIWVGVSAYFFWYYEDAPKNWFPGGAPVLLELMWMFGVAVLVGCLWPKTGRFVGASVFPHWGHRVVLVSLAVCVVYMFTSLDEVVSLGLSAAEVRLVTSIFVVFGGPVIALSTWWFVRGGSMRLGLSMSAGLALLVVLVVACTIVFYSGWEMVIGLLAALALGAFFVAILVGMYIALLVLTWSKNSTT